MQSYIFLKTFDFDPIPHTPTLLTVFLHSASTPPSFSPISNLTFFTYNNDTNKALTYIMPIYITVIPLLAFTYLFVYNMLIHTRARTLVFANKNVNIKNASITKKKIILSLTKIVKVWFCIRARPANSSYTFHAEAKTPSPTSPPHTHFFRCVRS